eukprot:COSAG05_NODE_704_length_7857_cov_2.807038_3_plen_42_part_00
MTQPRIVAATSPLLPPLLLLTLRGVPAPALESEVGDKGALL